MATKHRHHHRQDNNNNNNNNNNNKKNNNQSLYSFAYTPSYMCCFANSCLNQCYPSLLIIVSYLVNLNKTLPTRSSITCPARAATVPLLLNSWAWGWSYSESVMEFGPGLPWEPMFPEFLGVISPIVWGVFKLDLFHGFLGSKGW